MGEEIPMTTPAIVQHIPKGEDLEDMKMCFWLGSAWESKDPPQPIGKDIASTEVYNGKGVKVRARILYDFQEHHFGNFSKKKINHVKFSLSKVYVRQFGGFAMSHDDYASEYEKLVDDLKKDEASFIESGEYIFVSYNSPFEMENRRNEVWIKVKE